MKGGRVSDVGLVVLFVLGAGVSLTASWVLVSRLERVGARLGVSEALLGLLAALAADAPEITAAITALGGHHAQIGTGVVIGSNVFNLAALLGFAAVVAGRIALHRRVIVMEGAVAMWVAAVCFAVVVGVCPAAVALALVLVVLVPYVVLLGVPVGRRYRLAAPARVASWLREAVAEEEVELTEAIHPRRGRGRDCAIAVIAVLVVVGASVVMEQTGSRLAARHAIPDIVECGQHQRRGPHVVRSQTAADLEAVVTRQHHVEQDQVVVGGHRAHHRLLTVGGDVDAHPAAAQPIAQQRNELQLVLYDKDTHSTSFARVRAGTA